MILITGITGLLGSNIAKKLLQEGKAVRGLKRTNSNLSLLGNCKNNIDWVEGDVLDISSLEEAMQGISQVYHCAAMISFEKKDVDLMMKINIEGTANVVNACLDSGVKKLLYVSSVAAFGRPENMLDIDESVEAKDSKDNFHYFRSKLYAEREAWRALAEGLETVIICPSTIFGGGFWNMAPANLFPQIEKGLKFYTAGSNAFVDVRDVTDISIQLMEGNFSGEKYIVSAENKNFQELISLIATALNKPVPTIKVGNFLGNLVSILEKIKSHFTDIKPAITKETFAISSCQFSYKNDKIVKTLHFTFRPLSETILDNVKLYIQTKDNGFGIFVA